jgi:glycine/D-amino acid oxidase-like deaminating enzyme
LIEKVKYIIVGQGLVGTWMSYHLHKAGISFKVINDPTLQSASSVASGVINPVTGRRIVQTWMIETILPYIVKAYQNFAHEMDCEIIVATRKKNVQNLLDTFENLYEVQLKDCN